MACSVLVDQIVVSEGRLIFQIHSATYCNAMKNKHAESPWPPSERPHPSKPVSFIKEFASQVSSAFGLYERDSPVGSSPSENDANLLESFQILSYAKEITSHNERVPHPSKPGSSGPTRTKILREWEDIQIPEFTKEEFWSTKDYDYESIYNDDSEWDYIPEDSPLKGKDPARRIRRHFGLPPLPPAEYEQCDPLPQEFYRFRGVRRFPSAPSDFWRIQDPHSGHPHVLRSFEERWIMQESRLSKKYNSRWNSGGAEARFYSKSHGNDSGRDCAELPLGYR